MELEPIPRVVVRRPFEGLQGAIVLHQGFLAGPLGQGTFRQTLENRYRLLEPPRLQKVVWQRLGGLGAQLGAKGLHESFVQPLPLGGC